MHSLELAYSCNAGNKEDTYNEVKANIKNHAVAYFSITSMISQQNKTRHPTVAGVAPKDEREQREVHDRMTANEMYTMYNEQKTSGASAYLFGDGEFNLRDVRC